MLFKTNDEKFSLGRVKSIRRFADIQEEMCFRAVWRWEILESKLRGWNDKKKLNIICIKVMVKRK